MADRPMTDFERSEWIAASRRAMNDLHPQNQAFDSYERIRQAAAARGDRAEPIERGTTFTVVGRKMADHEPR